MLESVEKSAQQRFTFLKGVYDARMDHFSGQVSSQELGMRQGLTPEMTIKIKDALIKQGYLGILPFGRVNITRAGIIAVEQALGKTDNLTPR